MSYGICKPHHLHVYLRPLCHHPLWRIPRASTLDSPTSLNPHLISTQRLLCRHHQLWKAQQQILWQMPSVTPDHEDLVSSKKQALASSYKTFIRNRRTGTAKFLCATAIWVLMIYVLWIDSNSPRESRKNLTTLLRYRNRTGTSAAIHLRLQQSVLSCLSTKDWDIPEYFLMSSPL